MTQPQSFRMTPWVWRLLIANVAVFFLQLTVFTGAGFVRTFGFVPDLLLSHPWSLVTYMFLHGGFMHLAVNMFMLLVFGPAVEERMGSGGFIGLYLVSGLGGAVLSIALPFWMGPSSVTVVGASGALFGVAVAFARFWPDARIFVFPLPVPIKAAWLVAFLAAMSLVAAVFAVNDGVAHLAHLGGFVFGLLYLKWRSSEPEAQAQKIQHVVPTKVLVQSTGRRAREARRRTQPAQPRRTRDEIDRILDKISSAGIDALTPDERRLLLEASRQLKGEQQ